MQAVGLDPYQRNPQTSSRVIMYELECKLNTRST